MFWTFNENTLDLGFFSLSAQGELDLKKGRVFLTTSHFLFLFGLGHTATARACDPDIAGQVCFSASFYCAFGIDAPYLAGLWAYCKGQQMGISPLNCAYWAEQVPESHDTL